MHHQIQQRIDPRRRLQSIPFFACGVGYGCVGSEEEGGEEGGGGGGEEGEGLFYWRWRGSGEVSLWLVENERIRGREELCGGRGRMRWGSVGGGVGVGDKDGLGNVGDEDEDEDEDWELMMRAWGLWGEAVEAEQWK